MYDQQEGVESSSRIVDEYGDGHNLDRLQTRNYYLDRKSTRLNSSHSQQSRMPSSA